MNWPRWTGETWNVYDGVEWVECDPPPLIYDALTKTYFVVKDSPVDVHFTEKNLEA